MKMSHCMFGPIYENIHVILRRLAVAFLGRKLRNDCFNVVDDQARNVPAALNEVC